MSSCDPSNDNDFEQDPRPLQAVLAQADQTSIDLKRVQAENEAFAALARVMEQAAQEDDDTSYTDHRRG